MKELENVGGVILRWGLQTPSKLCCDFAVLSYGYSYWTTSIDGGGGTCREVCSIINAPDFSLNAPPRLSAWKLCSGYPIALQRPKTIKIPTSKEMVYDIILYYISKI